MAGLSGLPLTYVCVRSIHALVLRIPQELFCLLHGMAPESPVFIERKVGARQFDQEALAWDLVR